MYGMNGWNKEIPGGDLVSREAVIREIMTDVRTDKTACLFHVNLICNRLERLPSAQPEKRTENRAETHACDLISRQAAIDVCRAPHMRNTDCSDFEDDEM